MLSTWEPWDKCPAESLYDCHPYRTAARTEERRAERSSRGLRQGDRIASLSEIGRLGRALGIHVIASTQQPDAKTITPQLNAQFSGEFAFFARTP
jgi:hypothetical protein